MPGYLLRNEVEQTDSAKDIVVQLAEAFWVSKAFYESASKRLPRKPVIKLLSGFLRYKELKAINLGLKASFG